MTYKQKEITCRQCFIDNTYICQTKSKHHFFIFIYTGNVQTFTAPINANYIVELYGAEGGYDGGRSISPGGYGGLVKAKKNINSGTVIYIYVGGMGITGYEVNTKDIKNCDGGWNGGGAILNRADPSGAGGGGTDIRIGGTAINNRILVAGGGGGCAGNGSNIYKGGHGGASGSGNNGTLFYGSSGSYSTGGGGYYGGKAGTLTSSAQGGSNYIGNGWTQIYNGTSTHIDNGSCLISWHPNI